MNRYDQFFDFRMAAIDDTDDIMAFIKAHWNCDHILANDRAFFQYHYGNRKGGINVYLMLNKKGGIEGILGFVQYSEDMERKYITGSVTKVRSGLPLPMCGIELMKRFYETISPFTEFGCGVNPRTMLPVFENIFKYHTGKMEQYYLVNNGIRDFKIITFPCQCEEKEPVYTDCQYELVKLTDIDNIRFDFEKKYRHLPFKDKSFLNKRYFRHPIYKYDVYGIGDPSQYEGVLFTRKEMYNEGTIILIVDFVGDIYCLGNIRKALERILKEEKAECISFLEAGMPLEILESSGFSRIDQTNSEVIIPTYFQPFVNSNISNYYAAMEEDLIIFKAAGDQDNPR